MTLNFARRSAQVLLLSVFVGWPIVSLAQDVRIGVFGLFHPHELVVRPASDSALVVKAGEQTLIVQKSSGADEVRVSVSDRAIRVGTREREIQSASLRFTSRDNGAADFILAIPGKISRRYHGTLGVERSADSLLAVVTMDLETAVASIVAAESAPDAPIEALKAQAIVARSYLVAAKGRHPNFDFCDTTHCQFLRNPPAPDTRMSRAVSETSGLVLTYGTEPVAAMYTRSCGGRTLIPSDIGIPSGGYPYYSVACKYCRKHPAQWESTITLKEAADLQPGNESARLDIDRLLGWSTVPSNHFTMRRQGDRVLLQGLGEGHGIGLCQVGAAAMAREGATFCQILSHYYPNTAVNTMATKHAIW